MTPKLANAIARIETWIANKRELEGVPGCSAVVVFDQEVIWSKGFGLAQLSPPRPATAETMYRIASNTKLFTATALMQLAEQGKLTLDSEVSTYLPEFKAQSRFPGPHQLSLRAIAAHAAGLPREVPSIPWSPTQAPSDAAVLASFDDLELVYEPWTTHKYSNFGYAILGLAIARVSGESYTEYIERHIIDPLDMRHSAFRMTDATRENFAIGYDGVGDLVEVPSYDSAAMAPAGGLIASADDLGRFMALQFSNQPPATAPVVSGQRLREMRQPVFMLGSWESAQSLGWLTNRKGEFLRMYHGGGLPGYSSQLMVLPELKLGVALLANLQSGPLVHEACELMLDTLMPLRRATLAVASNAESHTFKPEWGACTGVYDWPGLPVEVEIRAGREALIMVERGFGGGEGTYQLEAEDGNVFRKHSGFAPGERIYFKKNASGAITHLVIGTYELPRRHDPS